MDPPTAGLDLDIDGFRALWPAVLDSIREVNGLLCACLSNARPVALEGATLTIAFDQREGFQRKKADAPANRQIIIDAVRSITGITPKVVFDLRDLAAEEATGAAAPPTEDELLDRLKAEFDAEEILPDAPDAQESSSAPAEHEQDAPAGPEDAAGHGGRAGAAQERGG
jgi:hypothetical protein